MRKDFKIIVASASMNIELFERYFRSHKIGNFKS
jgi:HrpA-like RNA helicase